MFFEFSPLLIKSSYLSPLIDVGSGCGQAITGCPPLANDVMLLVTGICPVEALRMEFQRFWNVDELIGFIDVCCVGNAMGNRCWLLPVKNDVNEGNGRIARFSCGICNCHCDDGLLLLSLEGQAIICRSDVKSMGKKGCCRPLLAPSCGKLTICVGTAAWSMCSLACSKIANSSSFNSYAFWLLIALVEPVAALGGGRFADHVSQNGFTVTGRGSLGSDDKSSIVTCRCSGNV